MALGWVVGRTTHVGIEMRDEGEGRRSGYDLRRLPSHFWRLGGSSGTRAPRLVSLLWVIFAVAGLAYAMYVLVSAAFGSDLPPGWTSIMVVLLLSTGGTRASGSHHQPLTPGPGPRQAAGLVSQLCAAHLGRRPAQIRVSLDTLRDDVFAPNAADLLLDAMDRLREEEAPSRALGGGGASGHEDSRDPARDHHRRRPGRAAPHLPPASGHRARLEPYVGSPGA